MRATARGILYARIDELCQENERLRAENERLQFRAVTLHLMVTLMHYAIRYMQGHPGEMAEIVGIKLSVGYFEKRMTALGILGIDTKENNDDDE